VNPRRHLPLLLAVAVLIRVPFWVEALRTPVDGDTAIMGLMARHPFRSATMWGQPYGSPLEAWLALPFLTVLGPTGEGLRLMYFLLGLGLVPLAYALAGRLDPRAALPAGALLACPPPYFLVLSSMPPPLYPSTLVLGGVLLLLALRAGDRLAAEGAGEPVDATRDLAAWGAVAGLALWTHLMSAAVVAACLVHLWWRGRKRRSRLLLALAPLVLASAPLWWRAVVDGDAFRIVRLTDRNESTVEHLGEVLRHLDRPIGALLGTHAPWLADDPDHVVFAPRAAAAGLVLLYGGGLVLALRLFKRSPAVSLLLLSVALVVLAFPLPLRSGPSAVRFLSLAYLPLAVLVIGTVAILSTVRRAWLLVLALASLHLLGARPLLAAWRSADRAQAPFLLPDLTPVARFLEGRGVRRAYAPYGPAYRLTLATGERVIASQPWNERFLHDPLPYLDEVRFAKNVAWVLLPGVPTDLPTPEAFESSLRALGGSWRRTTVGSAVVFEGFSPPFAPDVQTLPAAGRAGDGDPATFVEPAITGPTRFDLPPGTGLDALTLVAPERGPRLLRSMDVEVSADGERFETVVQRRRREERGDLRWVNGHPQYVIDHDLIAIPLGGRALAALRITPVASGEAWGLGEVLLHPARGGAVRPPWDEWLDPHLGWSQRRRALFAKPRADREDWYYRRLLAARHP
jgi:4-amino-4-deoxy-L-arabinose transferase-like glycosyltransferase